MTTLPAEIEAWCALEGYDEKLAGMTPMVARWLLQDFGRQGGPSLSLRIAFGGLQKQPIWALLLLEDPSLLELTKAY